MAVGDSKGVVKDMPKVHDTRGIVPPSGKSSSSSGISGSSSALSIERINTLQGAKKTRPGGLVHGIEEEP
jgi:hypothetical protein